MPQSSAIEMFLADQWGRELDREIHPADEMYEYGRLARHGAPGLGGVEYFRSGLLAYQALGQALAWRYGSVAATPNLLDFASGFGRTTRFLVQDLAVERVWIAEIRADAVAFQRERFGVHGYVTTHAPSSLPAERRFGAVFAASLFTHLPEASFGPWLERLCDALDDSGVVLFSTLGHGALGGRRLPRSGFLFEEISETGLLETRHYGTAWIAEAYLHDALARAAAGAAWRRYPGGLWHQQDLWLVARGGPSPDSFELDRGPTGFLEHAELDSAGRLRLAGWTGSAAVGEALPRVSVCVPGAGRAEATPTAPRPDAVAHFQLAAAASWNAELELPRDFQPEGLVLIKARSLSGREFVIFAGSLEAGILMTRADQLAARLAAAR
jgi:SAM-dependent methyltransferase